MGKGLVVAVVALVALTFSAVGEEPLPVVIAKAAPAPQVTTEVEPLHQNAPPLTLAGAARSNDFAAFDALYTARPNPAYADLHELWVYSQTERFGAFYGEELHARLARRYPAYAAHIDEYRIVDARGASYWPTAETRAFLLEHGGEAIGDQRSAGEAIGDRRSAEEAIGDRRSAIRQIAAAPKRTLKHVATPVKPKSAPVIAAPPAPLIADRRSLITRAAVAQPVQTADNAATGRGILLMILGLVGVGVLTLMLRTPAEEEGEPQELVPTLKLTSLPPATEPLQEQPRKTGSHG